MLQEIENKQRIEDLKLNVLQAIHFTIQGGMKLKPVQFAIVDPVLKDITDALRALNLPNPMQVE
ncbi:22027_t:CDS:2, partial [Gigaspora rosea]